MNQQCKIFLVDNEGRKFFGCGPAELLERVDQCGSLRQAAKQMYLSYSKAIKMIRAADIGFGFPLLETKAGGTGGGGCSLTMEGRRAVARFRAYEAMVQAGAGQSFQEYF